MANRFASSPPSAPADLDDHVAPVVWVTGHQQVAQLRFECHDPCLCGTLLVTAELALCTDGFGRQLASDGDVGLRGLELVHLAYDGLELLVAARQRAQLIGILRERWVREACEDLRVLGLKRLKAIEHVLRLVPARADPGPLHGRRPG